MALLLTVSLAGCSRAVPTDSEVGGPVEHQLADYAHRIDDAEADAENLTGESVASVGDLDGDGHGDVALGSRGAARDGDTTGRITIERGPFEGDRQLGEDAVVIWGQSPGDELGKTLLGGLDVDQDGAADLIIGCSLCDGLSVDAGRVIVLLGPLTDRTLTDADAVVLGGPASGHVGRAVSDVGDLDGDGWSELFVGANGMESRAGSAYLLAGPLHLPQPLDRALLTVHATQERAGLGSYLTLAGDTDGDGVDELAVSAYLEDTELKDAGVVYVFDGTRRGVVSLDDADARLVGEEAWTGRPLVQTGDATGDGLDDVLVGVSRAACSDGDSCGGVLLMAGPLVGELAPEQAWMQVRGEARDTWLGQTAVWADVDGDGQGDAVLGTFVEESWGISGGLWVLSDPGPGTHLASDGLWLDAPDGSGRAGSHLAAGDIDGDGTFEVMAGDEPAEGPGGAWIFSGLSQ